MQEFAYPPPDQTVQWRVVAIHLVLLGVALVPFVALFLQSRRPATRRDALLWLGCVILGPVAFVGVIPLLPNHSRPFVIGLLVLTEFVCLAALAITTARIYMGRKAVNAVAVISGLLGVILLVALLLPSVPSAREASRRMQCTFNLKQLVLAMHNYRDQFGQLPAPVIAGENEVGRSWRIALAPYLELNHLFTQYDHAQAWDAPANQPIAKTNPRVFVCPADTPPKDEQGRYFTAYAVPIGPSTLFPSERLVNSSKRRSSASTIAIVEACGRNIVWTKPEDVDTTVLPIGVNRPGVSPHSSQGAISSTHPGGANVALLDGSVRFVSDQIDPKVLRQLLEGK